MRRLFLILMMPAAACVSSPSDSAICQATKQARAEHAAALAEEGSDRAAVTGANLLIQMQEGCRA